MGALTGRRVRTTVGLVLVVGLACGGASTMTGPPDPADPVTSVDELAARLRGHASTAEGWLAPDLGGPVYDCVKYGPSGPDGGSPTPPGTVPVYTARLAYPGMSEPINVRFWLVDPAQAQRLVDEAQRTAEDCRGHKEAGAGAAGPSEAFPAARRQAGWRWSQSVEIGRVGVDTDPEYLYRPFAKERVLAARGALLAEISWYIQGFPGMPAIPWARAQGEAATAAVLSAAGGDPARPAPTRPGRPRAARLAVRLPALSHYGDGVRPGDMTMMCGNLALLAGPEPAAPRTEVTRSSAGDVSVTEAISVYADGAAAARRLRWSRENMDQLTGYPDRELTCRNHRADAIGYMSPVFDPRPEVHGPYRAGPYRRGPWTGHREAVAARLTDIPARPGHRDSVAHVRVVVRDGATVADLTWEAPAGFDLEGTVRRGEAALDATLDALAR